MFARIALRTFLHARRTKNAIISEMHALIALFAPIWFISILMSIRGYFSETDNYISHADSVHEDAETSFRFRNVRAHWYFQYKELNQDNLMRFVSTLSLPVLECITDGSQFKIECASSFKINDDSAEFVFGRLTI